MTTTTKLLYAPTQRTSQPNSILTPISTYELHLIQSSANPLRTIINPVGIAPTTTAPAATTAAHSSLPSRPSATTNSNRKRSYDDPSSTTTAYAQEDDTNKRFKSLNGYNDVNVVAKHYNARPNIDVKDRNESPIIGLKRFNNWIKSVLIAKYARRGQHLDAKGRYIATESEMIKVLDLGCGKGGDLMKWGKAGTDEYVGIDLAAISIEQARSRFTQGSTKFTAQFFADDCFEKSIADILPPACTMRLFDVVSMQFCMHYAFESESKAKMMLANATHFLKEGGIMIGTIPNSSNLLARVDAVPEDSELIEFGNEVYRVEFDERDTTPRYGHRYSFYLVDAVEEVPEYVVHWEAFVDLAAEYGLEVVFEEEFHNIFLQEKLNPEFGDLLRKMQVLDENEQSQMNDDQFEATNLYKGFVLRKVAPSSLVTT